jgi:hypothetical protein
MLFEQKRGQTNVTSLVERVSRFTVILKNPNKRTKPVMGKIMHCLSGYRVAISREGKQSRIFPIRPEDRSPLTAPLGILRCKTLTGKG